MVPHGRAGGNRAQRLRQAEQLLRLYHGRDEHVAVAHADGFRPESLPDPLTPDRVAEEHLGGQRCLAIYLMLPGNKVRCSCLDLDDKSHNPDRRWKAKTRKVYRLLSEHGLSALVEISQSGSGAHIWLFFTRSISAR